MEIGAVAGNFQFAYDLRFGEIGDVDHEKRIDLFEGNEIEFVTDISRCLKLFSGTDFLQFSFQL